MENATMKKKNSPSNAANATSRPGAQGWFPSREQISERARELWIGEGRPEKRDLHHWLRAEQELRAEHDRGGAKQSGSAPGGDGSLTREEIEADKRVDGLIERTRDDRSPKQERL
jgi:hypothetical protein